MIALSIIYIVLGSILMGKDLLAKREVLFRYLRFVFQKVWAQLSKINMVWGQLIGTKKLNETN